MYILFYLLGVGQYLSSKHQFILYAIYSLLLLFQPKIKDYHVAFSVKPSSFF